jgi:hypothetical protein
LNRQTSNRQIFAGNPIANLLVVIVGVLTIGAFIVLGVVAAVALGGIVVVLAGVLGIRMWWLGRKMPGQNRPASGKGHSAHPGSTVIEGEYRVVSADQDDDRPD